MATASVQKIEKILNRRNSEGKPEYYVRAKRNIKTDEYYVKWTDNTISWTKFPKLNDEIISKIGEFEQELNCERPLKPLKNGMKPIRITGMAKHGDYHIFLCDFLGSDKRGLVLADRIYDMCPDLALRFFEKHVKLEGNVAKIEFPLSMQITVAAFFNRNIEILFPNDADTSENGDKSGENDTDISVANDDHVVGYEVAVFRGDTDSAKDDDTFDGNYSNDSEHNGENVADENISMSDDVNPNNDGYEEGSDIDDDEFDELRDFFESW